MVCFHMEWRQIQGTQHTIAMTADLQKRLIQFAIHTLTVLESDRDWNSDTIDAINAGATELKLCTFDDDSYFKSIVTEGGEDIHVHPFTKGESLLSYAQAAQRLGVSRETIYRYQRAGKLPAIRLSSKTVRFRGSDLARLLAGAEVTSTQEKLNNHMNK